MSAMTLYKPYLSVEEKNQLKIESLDLELGVTTHAIECPRCNNAGSFSVSKQHDGLLYNCFRHKCGVSGFIPTNAASAFNESPVPKKDVIIKSYKGDVTDIPVDVRKVLLQKYGFVNEDIARQGWMYDAPNHRILMPVVNLYGYRAGVQAKKLPGSGYTGPKAVTYWEVRDKIRLHFPERVKGSSHKRYVIVVEDILSATKVSKYGPACALLGTSMSPVQASFLAHNYPHMIMMLDPDAIEKAGTYRKKYGAMFKKWNIMALNSDPKDLSYQKIADLLGHFDT